MLAFFLGAFYGACAFALAAGYLLLRLKRLIDRPVDVEPVEPAPPRPIEAVRREHQLAHLARVGHHLQPYGVMVAAGRRRDQ